MMSACTFSVIIPTYNRLASLEACLQGIAALCFPRERFQVIVVNDGGEVIPDAIQKTFCSKLQVQFLLQSNRGPAAARNLGAARAGGDWFVFTDDDCIPTRTWLSEFALAISNLEGGGLLGGSIQNGVTDNAPAEASQMLGEYLYLYYHSSGKTRSQRPFFMSNNLAVPRSVFNALGGFDASMRNGEDRELCDRLLAQGLTLTYIPAARVVHNRRMNLYEFWRLHLGYGRGGFDYFQRQQARGTAKLAREPIVFYTDMLRYPWRRKSQQNPLMLSVLLALTQIANAFGFLQAMRRARKAGTIPHDPPDKFS